MWDVFILLVTPEHVYTKHKKHTMPESGVGREGRKGWSAPSACIIHSDLFCCVLKARDQQKKRRNVGEEMPVHVLHAVTFTFILASINLFSGFELRLSLTNDRHLGKEKIFRFGVDIFILEPVENVADKMWSLKNVNKRELCKGTREMRFKKIIGKSVRKDRSQNVHIPQMNLREKVCCIVDWINLSRFMYCMYHWKDILNTVMNF